MLSTPNVTQSATGSDGAPRYAAHEGMRRPWSPSRLQSVLNDPTRKARFAYAIRTARERRGLTPPQLAKLLDVQPSTVNAWEKPDRTAAPSILDLGPLCEALGVDANLFAVLPPIPAWEGETYLMDELSAEERAAIRAIDATATPTPADDDDPIEEGEPAPARGPRPKAPRGR